MNAIRLTKEVSAEPKASLVKRAALTVFKTVRAVADEGKRAPAKLASSFNDVRDAWVESRPNVPNV